MSGCRIFQFEQSVSVSGLWSLAMWFHIGLIGLLLRSMTFNSTGHLFPQVFPRASGTFSLLKARGGGHAFVWHCEQGVGSENRGLTAKKLKRP